MRLRGRQQGVFASLEGLALRHSKANSQRVDRSSEQQGEKKEEKPMKQPETKKHPIKCPALLSLSITLVSEV